MLTLQQPLENFKLDLTSWSSTTGQIKLTTSLFRLRFVAFCRNFGVRVVQAFECVLKTPSISLRTEAGKGGEGTQN